MIFSKEFISRSFDSRTIFHDFVPGKSFIMKQKLFDSKDLSMTSFKLAAWEK